MSKGKSFENGQVVLVSSASSQLISHQTNKKMDRVKKTSASVLKRLAEIQKTRI